jgi:SulP family sulfate permease
MDPAIIESMAGFIPTRLIPKLFTVLKEGYGWSDFGRDAMAGLIVAIVALPLAIAFAIASGVTPSAGLITAVVAGLTISCLGGSRVQIGGPTSAFVVLLYAIVQKHGVDGLTVATLLAGVFLVVMGFLRMGALIKFIPYPLSVGFTTGIALLIATTQLPDILGLDLLDKDTHFLARLQACFQARNTFNPWAAGLAAGTVLVAVAWARKFPKFSGSMVAIVIATLVAMFFEFPVETIGSRFGPVSASIPAPHLPKLSIDLIVAMSSPALAIALLASLETLLSASVADGMTGRRHRSDMELVALGTANILSPLFGAIPAVGAIARTATNIRSGGRTPVAGIVHALVLLLILVVAGKWAAHIPMAVLGAVLLIVAWNMAQAHTFLKLLKAPHADVLVLLTAFFLTVLIDLTVAIEVGFLLAMALFIKRISEVSEIREITQTLNEGDPADDPDSFAKRSVPPGVEIYELFGAFFFGAADKFKTALTQSNRSPKILVLRMRHVVSLDATGMRAIEEMHERSLREKWSLVLSGVHAQPMTAMVRSGLADQIGMENLCGNIDEALARAEAIQLETQEKKTGAVAAGLG